MNHDVIKRAIKAKAEVLSSPINQGIKIKAADIQGCKKKGFLSRLFKSKKPHHLLCILRRGEIPQDAKQWCSDILRRSGLFEIYDDWLIYIQQIIVYPSDKGMYVGSHALELCDLLNFNKPNLDSVKWDDLFDSENNRCLIYSVAILNKLELIARAFDDFKRSKG